MVINRGLTINVTAKNTKYWVKQLIYTSFYKNYIKRLAVNAVGAHLEVASSKALLVGGKPHLRIHATGLRQMKTESNIKTNKTENEGKHNKKNH